MATDAELLARVALGEHRALEELYAVHAPWLILRLGRRCGDRQLIDEAVQDTFVAVWRSAHRFRGDGTVGAWLWGIGIRRLIDRMRRESRPLEQLPVSEPFPTSPSAEQEALMDVGYTDVGAAVNDLSPELQSVIRACVLDGLTTREAARLLRLPRGTVKTRLMRARAQLQERLA